MSAVTLTMGTVRGPVGGPRSAAGDTAAGRAARAPRRVEEAHAAPAPGPRSVIREGGVLHATARARRIALAAVLLVVAGLGMLGGQAMAATPAGLEPTESVVVAPGDTLWAFATELVEPGEDVRDVVLAIQRLNQKPSAALQVGEVLLLPAP